MGGSLQLCQVLLLLITTVLFHWIIMLQPSDADCCSWWLHWCVYAVLLQAVLLPLLVDIDRVGPEGAAALRR
jgi:hypothetical protein